MSHEVSTAENEKPEKPTLDISRKHYDETEELKGAIIKTIKDNPDIETDLAAPGFIQSLKTKFIKGQLGKVERYQRNLQADAFKAASEEDALRAKKMAEDIKDGKIGSPKE